MTTVALYIPKPGSDLHIDPGSAIVGTPVSEWMIEADYLDDHFPEKLVIDYEGNRYGASNIVTLADRAVHAAGRHRAHYPTVARMVVDADQLVRAGTFYPVHGRIDISNAEQLVALMRYLDLENSDQLAAELQTTDSMEARR